MPDLDNSADEQVQSEAFDEDNLDAAEAGAVTNEYKTFEEMPDVLDVTAAAGDADEDDFDEEDPALDEALGADGVEPEADASFGADGARVSDQDLGAGTTGEDEVVLVYSGLMQEARGAQSSAAHWESRRLGDDDIEDLGYGPAGDDR